MRIIFRLRVMLEFTFIKVSVGTKVSALWIKNVVSGITQHYKIKIKFIALIFCLCYPMSVMNKSNVRNYIFIS
jgi:ribosomal protein L6P/L9E